MSSYKFEEANAKMKALGNSIVESTYKGWGKICTTIFKDGTKSTKHSATNLFHRSYKSKPSRGFAFEEADSLMKELGNCIVESTYKGWKKKCTIIFKDGTKSNKHLPITIYRHNRSKHGKPGRSHTLVHSNAKMRSLGNIIVESTFNGWGNPCTIITQDGTILTEYSPYYVYSHGYKSKPGHKHGKHPFESVNAKMKELGNTIVESTYKCQGEKCTIIFADGSKSTKHRPSDVIRCNYKSKPFGKYTFEEANSLMKELGNSIVESTFIGWTTKPCTIIFADGSKSNKHKPYLVYYTKHNSKPKDQEHEHTFETANDRMKELGNKIIKRTYEGWDNKCTIIFSDKTKSKEHTPHEVHSSKYISKPSEGRGFDVNKPGYLYFFAYKVYGKTISYKIGITNNNITSRFSDVNNKLKDKSKGSLKHCAALFYFPDGHDCLDAETEIKREFERVVIDNVVGGKNEMFSEEGALHAYTFTKMLKCCKEINGKSKRPEVKQLVKHIAKKL